MICCPKSRQLSKSVESQTDLAQRFIVCNYKGKGDAQDGGSYRGLNGDDLDRDNYWAERWMNSHEDHRKIVDGLVQQVVSIDDSQSGFVQGRGTADAIFVVRQMQEKWLAVNKQIYMAFLDT